MYNEGFANVYNEKLRKSRFIYKRGKLLVPYQFDYIGVVCEFSEGLSAVRKEKNEAI